MRSNKTGNKPSVRSQLRSNDHNSGTANRQTTIATTTTLNHDPTTTIIKQEITLNKVVTRDPASHRDEKSSSFIFRAHRTQCCVIIMLKTKWVRREDEEGG